MRMTRKVLTSPSRTSFRCSTRFSLLGDVDETLNRLRDEPIRKLSEACVVPPQVTDTEYATFRIILQDAHGKTDAFLFAVNIDDLDFLPDFSISLGC
jgi:hypothetical protein